MRIVDDRFYTYDKGSHLDDTSSGSVEISLELLLALFMLLPLDLLDLLEFLDFSLYWATLVDKKKEGYCYKANNYEYYLKLIFLPKSKGIDGKVCRFRAEFEFQRLEKRLINNRI
jgi:hypothetical protein